MREYPRTRYVLLLSLLALLALLPRWWRIDYDLPFVYNSDELVFTVAPSAYFFSGDFNPRDFRHPGSLLMYPVHLLLRLDYFRQASISGVSGSDYAARIAFAPGGAVYLGRVLNVLAATLSVLVFWGIARRVLARRAAGLAAVIFALTPMQIRISRIARTDSLALLLVLVSIYCALRFLEEGRWWGGLALFLSGVGGAAKYVALGAAAAAAVAYLLRPSKSLEGRKSWWWLAAGGLVPAGFFLGAPYVLLDWPVAWEHIRIQEAIIPAAYPILPLFPKLAWYLSSALPFAFGGVAVPLAALLGVFLPLRRDWRREAVTFVFPLLYLLLLAWGTIRYPRYVVYLLPFAAILAARAVQWVAGRAGRWQPAVFSAGLVLLLFQPVRASVGDLLYLEKEDVRTVARRWIEENIPAGEGIVYEASIPPLDQLDTGCYRHWNTGWRRIISRPLEVYPRRGYRWLVISRAQKRIVLRNPDRWPEAPDRYREIEEKCELMAVLTGRGGDGVDIYRIN